MYIFKHELFKLKRNYLYRSNFQILIAVMFFKSPYSETENDLHNHHTKFKFITDKRSFH